MSVYEAAQVSRLAALLATRDKLAIAMDLVPPTVLPQLTKQFRDTLVEIEELSPAAGQKETGLSDFERRLRERDSGAKTPRRTSSK